MSYVRLITSTLLAIFLVFGGVVLPQVAQAQSAENECTDSPDFTITSNDQVYALTGESFSYYVVTEEDTSYQLNSSLPSGLSFVGGQLFGTPETAGDYPIDFVASNACGDTTQTVNLTVVDSDSAVAQQTDDSQSASANESVGLNEIPDTGIVADTALTVGFYMLALLLIAAWFSRRFVLASNDGSGRSVSAHLSDLNGSDGPELGNFIPSQHFTPPNQESRSRRFGDGMRR